MVDYRVGHRRYHREIRYAFLLYRLENFRRIEFFYDDMSCAHARERMRSAPAVYVEQWDGMKLNYRIVDPETCDHLQRMHVKVTMRHHHTFRIRGGAGCVEELGKIIVFDVRRREIGRRGGDQSLVVVAIPLRFERNIVFDSDRVSNPIDDGLHVAIVKNRYRFRVV